MENLTQALLKAKLTYNPATGLFTWNKGQRYSAGVIAGTTFNGYIIIKLAQRRYRAHRLAWLYMTGEWPKNEIDHDNRDRADNRWSNLRDKTSGQNKLNAGLRKDNTSGSKGVHRDSRNGRFIAQITLGGRTEHLGSFATNDEAANCYLEASLARMTHTETRLNQLVLPSPTKELS